MKKIISTFAIVFLFVIALKAQENENFQDTILKSSEKGTFTITNLYALETCGASPTLSIYFDLLGSPSFPLNIIVYNASICPSAAPCFVSTINSQMELPFKITGLESNSFEYSIKITDADSHISSQLVTTIYDNPMIITDETIGQPTCSGNCNGFLNVNFIDNAIYPVNYEWSTTEIGQTEDAIAIVNLCAGEYVVTITDANGCELIQNYIISEPEPITISTIITNASCNQSDGSIQVNTFGGTPPYTYSIDDVTFQPDGIWENIPSGAYVIYVQDANNCTANNFATISNTEPMNISFTTYDVTCNGTCDGSATIDVTGGNPPYDFDWSNTISGPTNTNLCAGNYSVTVSDNSGCNDIALISITEPDPINISITKTNVSCGGFCDGTATVNATGGNPPLEYLWSNGMISKAFDNMCSGMHQVYVLDANLCETDTFVTILEPMELIQNATSTDAICGESNGSITITASGGTGTLEYSIGGVNYQTSNVFENLTSDLYYYYIKDASACSMVDSIFVNNINGSEINVVLQQNVSCNGLNDGNLQLSASGSTEPYTISWSQDSLLTSFTANNLKAGNYIVTVTDGNSCKSFKNFTISQPGTLFINVTKQDMNCYQDGQASVFAYGGTQPYSYLWSNDSTTNQIDSLFYGNYSVTVTDANLCTKTGNITLNHYCKNIIKGKIFEDKNSNCTIDIDEKGIANILLVLKPINLYAFTNSKGEYQFNNVNIGNYNIEIANTKSVIYSVECPTNPSTINVSFSNIGEISENNNFEFENLLNKIDLSVTLSSNTARPGFNYSYYIYYNYFGLDTLDATITLKHDSILTYTSSSVTISDYTYPEVKWNFKILPNTVNGRINSYFVVPTIQNGGEIGKNIHSSIKIEPFINDVDTLNNVAVYNRTITGSYDPNEKEVFPSGFGTSGAILPTDSILTYTIHFQNTGTDTAFTVIVIDTLSQFLDPASVVSGASSHNYDFDISGEGILRWTFNQILLVDSFKNEPASNGFITYSVKQKSNIPLYSQIRNKADIYFDFNLPITTNTTLNTIDDFTHIKTIEVLPSNNVLLFPNPTKDKLNIVFDKKITKYAIYNSAGMFVKQDDFKENSINVKGFSQGIYFLKLQTDDNVILFKKFIIE